MTQRPTTPLLDTVNHPADIRKLDKGQLLQLCDELRQEVISAVSVTGGHLGAGLGVVELTVAIHYVFDTPADKLIWDVGHQCYPHKVVTGRRDRIRTIRMGGGLSGFTKRSESEYDPFGAAHSSTSISAAIGFAIASKLDRAPTRAIAVIGDGAATAGMAYEAMNNAAAAGSRLVVILNDNDMSIAPPVGSLRNALARLVSSGKYLTPRKFAAKLAGLMPKPMRDAAERLEEYARGMVTGGTLFEELGFYYVGPVDGHDILSLVEILENVRDSDHGPMLIHAVTQKGKGYAPAESSADKYHGVVKFDVVTGQQDKGPGGGPPAYTKVFADALVAEATRDPKVVAITAAMPTGTGLDQFEKSFPDRMFDVGIAEQHALTSAAGMAFGGLHPVVAVYATFLNRAFDQLLMDVALHKAGVTIVLDRAGVTGPDGASHHGMWDMAMVQIVPGLHLAAPRDASRLREELREAVAIEDAPSVIRYSKGTVGAEVEAIERLGDGVDVLARRPAGSSDNDVLIVSVGAMSELALDVSNRLGAQGISSTVVDPRWLLPVRKSIIALASHHRLVVCIEDGVRAGGVGSRIRQEMRAAGVDTALNEVGLPVEFLDHGTRSQVLERVGLTAQQITHDVVAQVLGTKVPFARPRPGQEHPSTGSLPIL